MCFAIRAKSGIISGMTERHIVDREHEITMRARYQALFVHDPELGKLAYLHYIRGLRGLPEVLLSNSYTERLHTALTGDDVAQVLRDAGERLAPSIPADDPRLQEGIIYWPRCDRSATSSLSLVFDPAGNPLAMHLRKENESGRPDANLHEMLNLYRSTRYDPMQQREIRLITMRLSTGITAETNDQVSSFTPLLPARHTVLVDNPASFEGIQLKSMFLALEAAVKDAESSRA